MADPQPAPSRSSAPGDRPEGSHRAGRTLLDAAAGPLHPAARVALLTALDAGWADPRRLYTEGRQARLLLDQAREALAAGLGVRPPELSFLPGGPTALTAAVDGIRYAARRRGARLVASAVEHSAVLVPGRDLAARSGDAALLDEVRVDAAGRVDLDAWGDALDRPGTVVAALQSANGEVGTRQPLEAASTACRQRGTPLVVDAMASLGRDPGPQAYDVLVGDARSWAGPGGVGLLVVPERTRWRRPGPVAEAEWGRTDVEPAVPLVVAAAEAWLQTEADRADDAAATRRLVDRLRLAAAVVPDTVVVGDPDDRLPHVVTFSCLFVDGEALVHELDRRGFAVASGSACTASTLEPSHVLAAMGVLTHGNVRVTLPLAATVSGGAAARAAGVEAFCAALPDAVATVRAQLGDGPAVSARPESPAQSQPDELDARGERCPLPVIRLGALLKDLPPGAEVVLLATDPAARSDVAAFCRMRGHELVSVEDRPREDGPAHEAHPAYTAYRVRRG